MEIGDEKLIRVFRKIRKALSDLTKEYDAKADDLKAQRDQIGFELLRRLQERKSTQTKTDEGTAFIKENMTASIADENVFFGFVLESGDLEFFQKRISIEHLRAYMKLHKDVLPPGISIFRELEVSVRAPKKAGELEPSAAEQAELNPGATE